MKRTLLITLSALTLGTAALAEDTPAPTPAPSTTVTLPGNITASVREAWKTFVDAGGTAELLAADGTVIGSLNPDGTLTLTGTATLSDIKSVRLIPVEGDAVTVIVTRDLSKPGAIKIEYTDANGRTQSLPLPAVMNRMKATAPDDTDESAETEDEDGARQEGKGGKPSTNPGKGKR